MSLDPVRDDTLTIAVLPDTQQYAAGNPEAFHAMTRWIAEHRELQRIVFCTHVGDVVRHHDRLDEWAVGGAAMSRLDGVVPYGISVGNNDMDEVTGDAAGFCKTFAPRRFEGRPWYGGQIGDNANSWQRIEVAGVKLLFVHLECNAPDAAIAWADEVMAAHPDHRVVVTTHMFLGPIDKPRDKREFFSAPRGVSRWSKCHGAAGNSPQALWDKCLSRHPHVFLILCGDQSRVQAMRMELVGHAGNRVHACLCDYYGAAQGWLRLHRIAPSTGSMQVVTYGAVSGTHCAGTDLVPQADEHAFGLDAG